MTDSTGSPHSLAGLLDPEFLDTLDWDPSALADWPQIVPTAADSSAESQAGSA